MSSALSDTEWVEYLDKERRPRPESTARLWLTVHSVPCIVMADKPETIKTEMPIARTLTKPTGHFLHLEEKRLPYPVSQDPHNGPEYP